MTGFEPVTSIRISHEQQETLQFGADAISDDVARNAPCSDIVRRMNNTSKKLR